MFFPFLTIFVNILFMNIKREQLGYLESKENSSSMEDVFEFLKKETFDSNTKYYEVEIDGEIKAEDVKNLLQLPYEISMTEHNGKVLLSTGTEKEALIEHQAMERRYQSKLNLHTHIGEKDGRFLNAPSFSDVYISDFASEQTPLLLVTNAGILHYKKPTILEGKEVDKEARDIMLFYCQKKGVDVFGFDDNNFYLKQWRNLTYEEKIKLQREFLEDTGMIVKEAKWEDTEGIKELMDIINLKR